MSFKVFIVGDPGVGKTSMMLRFIDDTFLEDTAPTSGGQPGKKRQIEVDGKNVEVILFDTDGQERFGNITCSLYQGMHGTHLAIHPRWHSANGPIPAIYSNDFIVPFIWSLFACAPCHTGFIIAYDVNNTETFKAVDNWVAEMERCRFPSTASCFPCAALQSPVSAAIIHEIAYTCLVASRAHPDMREAMSWCSWWATKPTWTSGR